MALQKDRPFTSAPRRGGACRARPSTMQPSIVFVAALAAAVACDEPAHERAQPIAPLGSTHVTPPDKVPADSQPPVIAPPAPVLGLGSAARELSSHEGTPSHGRIIEGLRMLAEAGARLAPDRREEIAAIRSAADRLADSHAGSTRHADYTRSGLDAALRLFASASPPQATR